jgi:hypothetical protein
MGHRKQAAQARFRKKQNERQNDIMTALINHSSARQLDQSWIQVSPNALLTGSLEGVREHVQEGSGQLVMAKLNADAGSPQAASMDEHMAGGRHARINNETHLQSQQMALDVDIPSANRDIDPPNGEHRDLLKAPICASNRDFSGAETP